MKLVFAGTPDAAVPSLAALAGSVHDIVAVITREDAPLGRKRVLTPSPVAVAAAGLGLNVLKANRLDDSVTASISDLAPDLGVIVAYGGLVREPLLSVPTNGWVNLHFSLLPSWRGAAPVQRAIMSGDRNSGATVFQLVAGLDAGDILCTESREIDPHETAGELLGSLAAAGAHLLTGVVDMIDDGSARHRPQIGDASYAHKMTIEDARIDWTANADTVYNQIRGVTPEPGAFTTIKDTRVKILQARIAADAPALDAGAISNVNERILVGTGSLPVELMTIQPAGKKPMRAQDWFRGLPRHSETSAQ